MFYIFYVVKLKELHFPIFYYFIILLKSDGINLFGNGGAYEPWPTG